MLIRGRQKQHEARGRQEGGAGDGRRRPPGAGAGSCTHLSAPDTHCCGKHSPSAHRSNARRLQDASPRSASPYLLALEGRLAASGASAAANGAEAASPASSGQTKAALGQHRAATAARLQALIARANLIAASGRSSGHSSGGPTGGAIGRPASAMQQRRPQLAPDKQPRAVSALGVHSWHLPRTSSPIPAAAATAGIPSVVRTAPAVPKQRANGGRPVPASAAAGAAAVVAAARQHRAGSRLGRGAGQPLPPTRRPATAGGNKTAGAASATTAVQQQQLQQQADQLGQQLTQGAAGPELQVAAESAAAWLAQQLQPPAAELLCQLVAVTLAAGTTATSTSSSGCPAANTAAAAGVVQPAGGSQRPHQLFQQCNLLRGEKAALERLNSDLRSQVGGLAAGREGWL